MEAVAELPTGTVTFLFTDIEGSTKLLQELGDRYADALASGRSVLAVRIASDDRKGSATQILKANGARFVHFLGKFVIESMTPRQGEISAEGR